MSLLGEQPLSATTQLGGCVAHAATTHFSRVVPRDPFCWVFGARAGTAFADNAKYLFLHVASNHPEIRAIWLSEDPAVISDLREHGYEAYRTHSPRGLACGLRAGVTFHTHGFGDVCLACSGGALSVMLWHGTPLKRISWDDDFAERPRAIRTATSYAHRQFDVLAAATDATHDSFASGFRIDRSVIASTGYPRNDVLTGTVPGQWIGIDPAVREHIATLAEGTSLWLYLPTFREEGEEAGIATHLDFEALDTVLGAREAHLLVKAHPFERFTIPETCSRVHALPTATDIYPLLSYTDGLMTDYSSILFDYLLCDRPLVFYAYDRSPYEADRGFYYDYDTVTPGPIATDFEELLGALTQALDSAGEHDDGYARERARLRERFCQAGVNRSAAVCEAVFDRLGARY